ncbi:hypothetical protein Ahy_A02g005638 [Arachis hypogaea]|uniref:DYW domain-containing protein n=1 Tax=Arachis hypogaea TaxID=3818 RepID=A0A445E7A0_ARAHY|nr:hypothetical protein Ahy_A02g005638 [Arachis hypogaea]
MGPDSCISLLLRCKNVFQVRQVHAHLIANGTLRHLLVANKLLYHYVQHKAIDYAHYLFDRMTMRDPTTWSVMIGGFAKVGDYASCYATFREILRRGVTPDNYTLPCLVRICRDRKDLRMGRVIHCVVLKDGLHLDHFVCASLVDMYTKCVVVDDARWLFDRMLSKDLVTWTVMIAAYADSNAYESLVLFDQMREEGLVPDKVAMVTVVNACAKLGAMHRAKFVNEYILRNSFSLDVVLGTAMIDMFAKCGSVESAREVFDRMKERNVMTWSAMIAAYGYHEKAADSLLELHPQNPGHYVLLSNIYAKAGKWEKVARFRDMMTHRNLKKVPGWTWIEVDNKTYRFSVGDRSHPQAEAIYKMLMNVIKKLEMAGYVPDTDFVLQDVDEEVKQEMLYTHSEKLAIAFGLISIPDGDPIRISKNLRVCGDCHTFSKMVSAIMRRSIVVRDANRFHHFREGSCSCGDYW